MSERYSYLYTLPQNLYTVGSPVVISAGTLLKDNQNGRIIAQLKFRSISNKVIKAVKVNLSLFDTAGNPIGESVVYDYLDLSVSRNVEFGQKTPVPVSDSKARSYNVAVTEVVFGDRTVWTAADGRWEPLSNPQRLTFDDELLKQYRIKYGAESKYVAKEEKDLWFCTCGELNRKGEMCNNCHNTFAELQTVDMAELEREKAVRLEAEAMEAEELFQKAIEENAAKAESKKKTIKKIKIISSIACAVFAVVFVITNVIVPNIRYNDAVSLMNDGNQDEAYNIFHELGEYKDSSQKALGIELSIIKENAMIGNYIKFGSYEQDNDTSNGTEPVEWLILDAKDDRILVISKYALDSQAYNTSFSKVTWETCTLRKWLNSDFINAAFSADERAIIKTVTVYADKTPWSRTETVSGNATQDQVFILSITEVEKYFASYDALQCEATELAVANGARKQNGTNAFWLRNPGEWQTHAAITYKSYKKSESCLSPADREVNYSGVLVRPALWIELSTTS